MAVYSVDVNPSIIAWTNAAVDLCEDPEPYLLVGIKNSILRTNLDGGAHKQLASGVGHSFLMDFHYRESRVYWVDTHTGVLSRVDMDGTRAQVILPNVITEISRFEMQLVCSV